MVDFKPLVSQSPALFEPGGLTFWNRPSTALAPSFSPIHPSEWTTYNPPSLSTPPKRRWFFAMGSKDPTEPGRHPSSSNGTMNFESPFPRGVHRQRQAFSTPSCSAIRAPDSGYGTISPPSPSAALKEFPGFDTEAAKCLSRQVDGNQSEVDDPFADSDEENALVNQFTAALKLASDVPSRKKTKPTTLPRLTRSRSSLPQSFRTADNDIHLPRRQSDITVARQGAGSLRAPDRFIPLRSTSTDTTEKFRVGKAPHELSATEKILRHNGATEDAFCYRRRVVSPMVADTSAQPGPDSAPRRRRGTSVDGFDEEREHANSINSRHSPFHPGQPRFRWPGSTSQPWDDLGCRRRRSGYNWGFCH